MIVWISAQATRVVDRRHQLDAVVEVAGHHVRRADPVVGLAADREREDAGVLEEAAHDRDHAHVLAHARARRAAGR